MLADIQAGRDDRNLRVDEVGITGIRYPVAVADRERGKQDTIAEVSMSVDLPPDVKGAHLSRFVEVLHDDRGGDHAPGHPGHPGRRCGHGWAPPVPGWSCPSRSSCAVPRRSPAQPRSWTTRASFAGETDARARGSCWGCGCR